MNRRQFLASLMAVPLVAKAMMVTSHSPATVEGDLIGQILKTPFDGWKIHFPDGTIFNFKGVITSLERKASIDSLHTDTFSVRPTGEMKITTGRKQLSTTIALDGKSIGEVIEVESPVIASDLHDATMNGMFGGEPDEDQMFIPGVKRTGPMKFTVLLEAE